MFCTKCGKEILDDAVICIHCGCSTQNEPAANQSGSIGMAILGFFIPLAGLIIWLVNKDSKPAMAKSAGTGALIGVIVSVVLVLFYSIFIGSMIGSMMSYY